MLMALKEESVYYRIWALEVGRRQRLSMRRTRATGDHWSHTTDRHQVVDLHRLSWLMVMLLMLLLLIMMLSYFVRHQLTMSSLMNGILTVTICCCGTRYKRRRCSSLRWHFAIFGPSTSNRCFKFKHRWAICLNVLLNTVEKKLY